MASEMYPMSEDDRAFLLAKVKPEASGRLSALLEVLVTISIGTSVLSALALFVLSVIARLAGFDISQGAWRDSAVTYYGAFASVAVIFVYVSYSTVRHILRSRRNAVKYRNSLLADLEKGVVKVERLDVRGIKLLQEPEHYTFILLLNLSNGKTLVLYDYESFNDENDSPLDAKPALVVQERIALKSFPLSKRKRWEFEGTELTPPAPIELALDPEKWPEDESWCRVKWDNIERHYGPKPRR